MILKEMGMKITTIISGIMFFLSLSFSCGEKEIVNDSTEPEVEEPVQDDGLSGKDTESWVYRINKLSGRYEKFFGIVHYNFPGYLHHRDPDPDGNNEAVFKEKTEYVNTIIIDDKFVKPYMSDKVLIPSNYLRWRVQTYLEKQNLPDGADKDYYGTQFLKENVNNINFVTEIDNGIGILKSKFGNYDMEYNTIDEIGLGGVGHYHTPPVIGAQIYERIKHLNNNPLVIVDLMGHGRGSSYFFEENYLKNHSAMPQNPPYELLNNGARANTSIPLLGFYEAYDGTSVYNFDENGNYTYNNLDFETYSKIWFENIKRIAAAYRNSGNLFSLNAYNDFYKYPILSGVTVDAIKAGVEDMPVWLYFDGNGYSKPASMSPEEYVEIVKCQVYTSIIHGATGVMFWSTTAKEPVVFDALTPMLKKLNQDMDIFYMNTDETKILGDLHVMIKKSKGKKYIIASNTSRTGMVMLSIDNVNKKTLAPMEVYVSEIDL